MPLALPILQQFRIGIKEPIERAGKASDEGLHRQRDGNLSLRQLFERPRGLTQL